MHLRRLDIRNFRAIGTRDLRFDDAMGNIRPVTVLAGPNGAGKTTALYAIVQALRGAMGARIPDVLPPEEHDLYRAEPTGRRPVVATVKLELAFESVELQSIQRVFDDTADFRELAGRPRLHPPALPNGVLRVTWQFPPPLRDGLTRAPVSQLDDTPRFGAAWLAGPKYAWGGSKRRRLSQPDDLYRIGMLRFFAQTRDRRWGIDLDEEDDRSDGLGTASAGHGINGASPTEMTVVEALRRLGEWAHGQGLTNDDVRRSWESVLQQRFNRICAPKEYKGYWLDHPRFGETPLLADGGREYPFASAASGEHVILHYLTQFAFPRPVNNSLILIDEPELHLHPRWIRQLYRALPLMGENNQFILVTHSPDLRQLASEDNALIDLGSLGEPAGSVASA